MKKIIFGQIKDGQLKPGKEDKGVIQKFKDGWFELRLDNTKPRTRKQNRALHKFFEILTDTLNDAGLDQRKVLKPSYNIEWTVADVKEKLWRPFQIAVTKKESTTDLESQGEIERIHKLLMRELGEKHKVEFIPFPFECKECHGLSMHYDGCSEYAFHGKKTKN